LDIYLNLSTLCAYGILLIVTAISVIALKEIPLKVFYAIVSLNIAVVVILSRAILKENVNTKMITGIILIVIGIVIFNVPFV